MKEHLCYNCFREKPEGEGACPFCGFDLAENEKKYPVALRAGTVLNGRYIIGRVLGQGGFGITYLAYDRKLQAKVAVKEFMPNDIATRIGTTVSVAMESRTADFTYGAERFQEEARTLAKFMGQPGIAGVTDYFDENDTSYFVMDYIEGISFKTYIANQGGKISVEEALNVMIPVLRALTAVHAEGFIHRDVTPDNIYITKDGNIKLLDFGSARYSLGDKSKSLDVILKVGYAPKEQYIRRGRQGPYTDVYSCAACLYAALTGYLPPESLERLDQDTLVPPSQAGVELPLYLERAILKGLAVQPEDRFQSAAEFLEALESQQVVELSEKKQPSKKRKKKDMEETTPAKQRDMPVKPSPKQRDSSEHLSAGKSRRFSMMAGGAAAVVAVALVGAVVLGGQNKTGHQGQEGAVVADGGSLDVSAEGIESQTGEGEGVIGYLAHEVVIAGECCSTALTELELEVTELSAEDYQNLQEMVNLTSLIIRFPEGMGVDDITPFTALTKLETLSLGTDGLKDLSGLEKLTNLKELRLTGERALFPSLEPIGSLTKLQSLRLPVYDQNFEMYADISPLANCTELTAVRLDHNIADLSPLAGLKNLRSIHLNSGYMRRNQARGFQSLEALGGLSNLVTLSVRSEGLHSLEGLGHLEALESLELDVFVLDDISALKDLKQLKNVTFNIRGGGQISDLTPIDHVPNKNIVYGESIENVAVQRGNDSADEMELTGQVVVAGEEYLIDLDTLELSVDTLTEEDYQNLQKMVNLTSLTIRFPGGGGVDDITPFTALTKLEILSLGTDGLKDLSGLEKLTNLRELNLPGERAVFPSLEPIGSLTKLQSLRLPVYDQNFEMYADISPLANCRELRELRMDHKVADLTPLAGLTQMISLDLEAGYGDDSSQKGFRSLKPLSGLVNMVSLSLRLKQFRNLSGLENMHALENFSLRASGLEDIVALGGLEHLKNVTIVIGSDWAVPDLSPIDHVPNKNVINQNPS